MRKPSETSTQTDEFDAVVIGAGFAGIYALHKLRLLGLRCRLYETGDGVRGAWYWNRYPGAAAIRELRSTLRVFRRVDSSRSGPGRSGSPPTTRSAATSTTSPTGSISGRTCQFGTRVTTVVYDEESARWRVETDPGDVVVARYVISAIGSISAANVPEIPGLETFTGLVPHRPLAPTSRSTDGVRVGVIGTGSTAIQPIPESPEQAAELTVFQRTPNYCMPARNHPLDPGSGRRRQGELRAEFRAENRPCQSPSGCRSSAPRSRPTRSTRRRRGVATRRRGSGGVLVLQQFNDLMTDERSNDFAPSSSRRRSARSSVTPRPRRSSPEGSDRRQATGARHRLLRDLQQPARAPRRRQRGADQGDHAHRHPCRWCRARPRRDHLRHRVRRLHRARSADGHSWSRRRSPAPTVGRPGRPPISGSASQASRTCSRSTGRATRRCSPTCSSTIEHDVEWIADCVAYLEQHGITAIEPTEEAEDAWVRST